MANTNYHKLQLLPPKEEISPNLRSITSAYHALGEIKGRLTRDVIRLK